MEISKLFAFLEILKDSVKIMSKNGKLMAMATLIHLVVYSLFFVSNISTVKPLISAFVAKSMVLPSLDPHDILFTNFLVGIRKDIKTLLGVELAFVLAFSMVSLLAQTVIILLATVSYKDKNISPKDLLLRVPQPLKRLFITSFHTTLLHAGFFYFGFVTVMISTFMVSDNKLVAKVVFWVLMILLVSLYLYFVVVWVLALVVSVVEESCGIAALGKAGALVKGKRLEGFVLNVLFNVSIYFPFHVLTKVIMVKKTESAWVIFGLVMVSCICLVVVFEFLVYTVLYFKCKKNHGDDQIELQGSMEYSKIPNVPLVHEDLP